MNRQQSTSISGKHESENHEGGNCCGEPPSKSLILRGGQRPPLRRMPSSRRDLVQKAFDPARTSAAAAERHWVLFNPALTTLTRQGGRAAVGAWHRGTNDPRLVARR